jgi:hypothetical protein
VEGRDGEKNEKRGEKEGEERKMDTSVCENVAVFLLHPGNLYLLFLT